MGIFGNVEQWGTLVGKRQNAGEGREYNLVPDTRHEPMQTLYVRLPDEDELNSLARGVLLANLTSLLICQIEKNGPTAAETANCSVPARV